MKKYVRLFLFLAVIPAAGCHQQADDYVAASSISRAGFARQEMVIAEGQVVALWGFVDHSNLYGDDGAREILADWWSGPGPDDDTWRFNLKAEADDEVGHSFAVYVPNDAGRDDLLRIFVADARAQVPTRVFVTGRLYTYDAPSNVKTRTGLYLKATSADDVLFKPRARAAR